MAPIIAMKIRNKDLTEEWFEVAHADADIPGITWLYNNPEINIIKETFFFFVTPQDIVETCEGPD